MSIEDTQRLVDTITLGAQQAAAGASRGLGPDETIDILAAKKLQRQAQLQEADEIAGDPFDPNRIIREYGNIIQNDEPYPDPFGEYEEVIRDDRGREIERRRPQDDFQPLDRQEKVDRGVLGADFLNEAEIEQQKEARARGDQAGAIRGGKGLEIREGAGGRAGAADALARLEALEQFGGQERFAFSTEELAEIERLKSRLRSDSSNQEAGRRVVREDNIRFQRPGAREARKANDNKAAAQANKIAEERFQRGGEGAKADMNIERIMEIRRLGPGGAFKPMEQAQVIRGENPGEFPTAVRVVDGRQAGPGRTTLGWLDPGNVPSGRGQVAKSLFIGAQNEADSANALNAPLPKAHQWMVDNLPDFGKPGGDTFGFPTVDIMAEGRLFADRARAFGLENVPGDLRSLTELEGGANMIIEAAKAQGKQLFRFDPESRQNIAVEDPGIDEVLNALRYGPAEKARLANAMMQLEGGRLQDVNQEQKRAFRERRVLDERGPIPEKLEGPNVAAYNQEMRDAIKGGEKEIIFGAEKMRPEKGVPLALIKNEKVGRGKNAKMVDAELRRLDGQAVVEGLKARGQFDTAGIIFDKKGRPVGEKRVLLPGAIAEMKAAAAGREEAQKPLFGAVKEEGAPRAAFIRGDDRNKSTAQLEKKFGPKNAAIAAQVRDRADAAEKAQGQPPKPDSFAQEQRGLDAAFAEKGRQVELDKQAIEIGELARLQKLGRFKGEEVNLNEDSRFRAERLERVGKGVFRERQPITQAAAPMSIAPVPGDVTGSQPAPAVDAGRGGWMGGGGSGRIVNPYAPEPEDEGRPLTPGLREELNNLQPTKSRSRGYMVSPDGPTKERERREVTRGIQRENTRKRVGYGAAGSGIAAGLAALIGGEREAREEEAMV